MGGGAIKKQTKSTKEKRCCGINDERAVMALEQIHAGEANKTRNKYSDRRRAWG